MRVLRFFRLFRVESMQPAGTPGIIDGMSSPFPGMDPYLEPHWLDVHLRERTLRCRLDYHREPGPPLDDADAAWADALLKAAGKR